MKRMHGQGEVYEGGVFLILGQQIERQKKLQQVKYDKGLGWLSFDILFATTNQKHVGVTEGGWDRLRDRARTLGERDGNGKPLAKGDDDNSNYEYGDDGKVPNNDDECPVGIGGVNEPLDECNDDCGTLSAAPARACPESQQPSVPSR